MQRVMCVENVGASEIISRLERIENAIVALSKTDALASGESGYMTRREVAALFRVTLTTVHDWTRKGILQAYKTGNRIFFKRDEVENALKRKH